MANRRAGARRTDALELGVDKRVQVVCMGLRAAVVVRRRLRRAAALVVGPGRHQPPAEARGGWLARRVPAVVSPHV